MHNAEYVCLPHQPQPRRGRYGSSGRRGWGGRVLTVVVTEDPGLTGPTWWEVGRSSILASEAVCVPGIPRPMVGHRALAVLSLDLGDHHSRPSHDRWGAIDGPGRTTAAGVDDRHIHFPALSSICVGPIGLLNHELLRRGILRRERVGIVSGQPVDDIVQLAIVDRLVVSR